MKRVFEFYTGKGQQDITTLAESLECVRRSGKPTRITVEPLPESKPEPCEECTPYPGKTIIIDHYGKCVKCGRLITPEPDHFVEVNKIVKNCGNCRWHKADNDCARPMVAACLHYDWWQPKAAETQGWEQRFDKEFPHCGGAFKTSLRAFIRAEIERVREEEKQAIINLMFEDESELIGEILPKIEQNKHRSEK